ncbi:MAG TPA: redoxin domain-containing protein [Chloroflexota bacterium]|nr:redoxin domain-containing protein [Chloroflexota bacterium]
MEWMIVGVAVSWVLLVVVGFLCYRMVTGVLTQSGRLVLTVERLEQLFNEEWGPRVLGEGAAAGEQSQPSGLAPGSEAPAFALPSLRDAGQTVSLEQYIGKNVLLVFVGPSCGYCDTLAPKLASVPIDGGDGRPIPLVITKGTSTENQKYLDQYRLPGPVLLGPPRVEDAYKVVGTPMGYLIDRKGVIASELLIGEGPILSAAKSSVPQIDREPGHPREAPADETVVGASST